MAHQFFRISIRSHLTPNSFLLGPIYQLSSHLTSILSPPYLSLSPKIPEGKISQCEAGQVSLLLHNQFNASISTSHLPASTSSDYPSSSTTNKNGDPEWEFVEDPEATLEAERQNKKDRMFLTDNETMEVVREGEGEGKGDEGMQGGEAGYTYSENGESYFHQAPLGFWRKKDGGEKLGGESGRVKFTIIR